MKNKMMNDLTIMMYGKIWSYNIVRSTYCGYSTFTIKTTNVITSHHENKKKKITHHEEANNPLYVPW